MRELLSARLLPDRLEAHALFEHLGGVARGRLVEGAGVALQGGFLILAISVIVLNFIADLVYFRLDPRITL